MEFHEKLQELRKSRGLTQEELSQALYVSRTAISKWESGRGYPSIDSLKEISSFFSVSIDELLSGDKLINIAEKENLSNIQSICDMIFAVIDVMAFMLIVLPLYPNTVEGYVYSVNLIEYTEISALQRGIYLGMFIGLIVAGIVKILFNRIKIKRGNKLITELSILLNVVVVLFLAIAREPYGVTVAFVLLVMKGILVVKGNKNEQFIRK